MLALGLLPLSGSAQAAASYKPSHTFAAVKKRAAMPANSWQKSTIRSKGQRNWYRVNLKTRSYLYALLGNLPANYSLRLYDAKGQQLNVSDHAGTKPESIGRMLDAGTYYLLVGSSKGYSKSKSYDLLARVVPKSSTIGVIHPRFAVNHDSILVGELVNVSDRWLTVPLIDAWLYDSRGRLIRKIHWENNTINMPMAPGARVPFDAMTYTTLAQSMRTVRVKVKPVWEDAWPVVTPIRLKVSEVKKKSRTDYGYTTVTWSAKVTNASRRDAYDHVALLAEARDKRGVLVGLDSSEVPPRLPAGTTRKVSVTYLGWEPGPAYNVRAVEVTHFS